MREMIDRDGGHSRMKPLLPDEIFEFYKAKGYRLTKLICGYVGLGWNRFVFQKESRK